MNNFYLLVLVVASLALGIPLYHRRRRAKLMKTKMSVEDLEIIKTEVPLLAALDKQQKERLMGLIKIFFDEVEYIPCGGLKMDKKISLSIAAQACLLTVNNPTQKHFEALNTIYVYPQAFKSNISSTDGGIMKEEESIRLGQSQRGSIVLSWDDCQKGASHHNDGQNVVFHEFAHQLDQEHGSADGVPILENRSAYLEWGKIMYPHFLELREKAKKHQASLIDPYGATNEAEFFAVCTELFFERGDKLKQKHPDIYSVMQHYYGLDTANFSLHS